MWVDVLHSGRYNACVTTPLAGATGVGGAPGAAGHIIQNLKSHTVADFGPSCAAGVGGAPGAAARTPGRAHITGTQGEPTSAFVGGGVKVSLLVDSGHV
jgi:hypothetical protein